MTTGLSTPLEPREFFSGSWNGQGEVLPVAFFRWLAPVQSVNYGSRATWLSDTVWMVEERFSLSSGYRMDRTMFLRLLTPNRAHVTADDMPGGADITLTETGFDSTPYIMWVPYRGRKWWVRCRDHHRLDQHGMLHTTIRIRFAGIPVATMSLTIRREAGAQTAAQPGPPADSSNHPD